MKNTGRGSRAIGGKSGQDVRKDRKSRTGMDGLPKKGGHGGKFTWSGDGYSQDEMGWVEKSAIDVNDPNFKEPAEENINSNA